MKMITNRERLKKNPSSASFADVGCIRDVVVLEVEWSWIIEKDKVEECWGLGLNGQSLKKSFVILMTSKKMKGCSWQCFSKIKKWIE